MVPLFAVLLERAVCLWTAGKVPDDVIGIHVRFLWPADVEDDLVVFDLMGF